MGKKGLELVKTYPKTLPQDLLNQIVVKSMPFSAKEGDFTTNTVENNVFSGYVFSIPEHEGRKNIACLVAVYRNMKYNAEAIKKIFSFTITELKRNDLIDLETLTKILPNLYKGIVDGHLKVNISSVVTLEFDFKKKRHQDKDQEALNELRDDIWK